MRYEVVLRYDYGEPHEYVFARNLRRHNGALAERDGMVATTYENMLDHANGRPVEVEEHEDGSVTIRCLPAIKTVLIREADSL